MNLEHNKALVRAFYEAGNRGEIDTCLGLMADDVEWTTIGSTKYSGRYRGKAEIVEKLIGPLFSQLKAGIHSLIDHLIAEGEFVVAQTRGQAETQDGRPYNNCYCHVFRIGDGRIRAVTEYLDTALADGVLGN